VPEAAHTKQADSAGVYPKDPRDGTKGEKTHSTAL